MESEIRGKMNRKQTDKIGCLAVVLGTVFMVWWLFMGGREWIMGQ